jgi:hypothetical protein
VYYFSKSLDNDRTLCIAPLTDRLIERSGQEIEDVSGYFLFAHERADEIAGVEIIARVVSEEAAFALRDLFDMR